MPGRQTVGGELYRYSFQGQEKDSETGKEAFELRLWDGRIGRWLSPDPESEYDSPYLGMGNNPVKFLDKKGDTIQIVNTDGKLIASLEEHKKGIEIMRAKSIEKLKFDSKNGEFITEEVIELKTIVKNGVWKGNRTEFVEYIKDLSRLEGFSKSTTVGFKNSTKDGMAYLGTASEVKGKVKNLPKSQRGLIPYFHNSRRKEVLRSYWNTRNALGHEHFHFSATIFRDVFFHGEFDYGSTTNYKKMLDLAIDYQKMLHSWSKTTKTFRSGINNYRH